MLRRLGRSVLMAAALAAGLAGGQSAHAGFSLSLDLQDNSQNSNSGAVTVATPASGTTYLIGLDSSGNTLVTTSTSPGDFYAPSGDHGAADYFYSVKVTYSEAQNTAAGTTTAQLVDMTTTVSKSTTYSSWLGNYSGPNPDPNIVIKLGYDQFTAPTGPSVQLKTALTVNSITNGSNPDYPAGNSDQDKAFATGQLGSDTINTSTATSNEHFAGTPVNGNVQTLSNNSSPFTMYNILRLNLGGDADSASVDNTVTLTGPAAVPEPSTIVAAIAGLGALGLVGLRRRMGLKVDAAA